MRIMVALENRFLKTTSGNIYSTTVCDYNFFSRYLKVFDEVIVFARVSEVPESKLDKHPANGPNVSFYPLPTFIGPWQFLRHYRQLTNLAKHAITQADAFLLRTPGTVATLLWRHLRKRKIPYSVEVVGDPWDSFAPGSVKSISRPFVRRKMTNMLAQQCRLASVASYVTEYSLQERYPPNCWSTHYSSVELPFEAILNDSVIESRIARIKTKSDSDIPFRICHVGMMEHFYKAPDILIEAVAACINKGINIELLMIGEGRFKSQLQEQVKKLGIAEKVTFLGKLTHGKSVYEVLDKTDLYVLPSRQEGLPRTVIEAMARGLPCISSNVGGIPELLAEEDLVPPGDSEKLADKIQSVIRNPERLKRMAIRNLEKAKEYRSAELNKRRVEFYKKVEKAAKTSGTR